MIPVHIIRYDVVGDDRFQLGTTPGSALRGALYEALSIMYDTHQDALRDDISLNPVAWLLRLEDDNFSGGKDVPRPLAVRPPTENNASKMTFSTTFYGRAYHTIPMVISAIPMMGQLGIGRKRTKFVLKNVETVDPLTGKSLELINEAGETVGSLLKAPSSQHYQQFAELLNPSHIDINFITPTRIVESKRVCHQPLFRPWFQRLLERIYTISKIYADTPLWIPFGDLLQIADTIKIVENNTTWYESSSMSRRDGLTKPLGGFIGLVRYEGNFTSLLPYILLGQGAQVGKNTIKGCGWYDLVYEWATLSGT
jgi:hypothetical protein